MFKDRYQALYTQVIPEEKLLQATKDKMKPAVSKSPTSRRVRFAVAACLVVATAFLALPKPWNFPSAIFGTASVPFSHSGDFIHMNDLDQSETKPKIGGGWGYLLPEVAKWKTWSMKEYVDYIKFDPQKAAIPKGLTFAGESTHHMAYGKDGALCKYYNTWTFSYSADKDNMQAKEIRICTDKDKIPYGSTETPGVWVFADERPSTSHHDQLRNQPVSIINGTEVVLSYKKNGVGDKPGLYGKSGDFYKFKDYYFAAFWYKDVGFTVTAENGVTQQEFIDLLSSILKR